MVAAALGRPASGTRIVCLDGPAGAGKTTMAAAVVAAAPGDVALLHMDDVYEGWSGLAAGMEVVARDVVGPLLEGRPGRYRRWDWYAMAYAEEHEVSPGDLLVVEGVGSGNVVYADATTLLVWVDGPPDVRLERGVARDGEGLRAQWAGWTAQEETVFAAHRTRQRADLVVDGVSGRVC
ncbi:MAG: 4-amino-4-deoxy-L-arabinose transferase [Nocardioidaceae bacterium]|nr:4-amino-4-deoxy-L-arabinose transferase [Nocardioidaceae bacterium]NUS50940.1 4-amino-4-deoxy-L-arabinose transferase [Nocardioidaceae bacterium]